MACQFNISFVSSTPGTSKVLWLCDSEIQIDLDWRMVSGLSKTAEKKHAKKNEVEIKRCGKVST